MSNKIISEKQIISMMTLFICGGSIMFGTAKGAKSDVWIALICALIIAIIMVLIYSRILVLCPNMDFFCINKYVFGKGIGNFINVLYIWFWFCLVTLILFDYSEFMRNIGLNGTPIEANVIIFMFFVAYILKQGIETMGRWCELFVVFIILILIFTIILMIPIMNIENLMPFFSGDPKTILQSTFSAVSFPLAEIMVFMTIFDCVKIKRSYYKVYFIGLILGWFMISMSSITDMLVLGSEMIVNFKFPSYMAISKINIRDFITRIEIISAILLLLGSFSKAVICMLSCCKGIERVFNINDYKKVIIPSVILAGVVSMNNFGSIMELIEWDTNIWTYFSLVFQIIVPIIILICAEIKCKTKT